MKGRRLGDAIKKLSHTPTSPSDHYPEVKGPRLDGPAVPARTRAGRPAGTQEDLFKRDLSDLRASENCVTTLTYRPRSDSVVLVVAATDVAERRGTMAPLLGPRLGIVHSRWSNSELAAITDVLRAGWHHWAVCRISLPVDNNAQSSVDTEVLHVSPDLAQWAARLPDGILEIRPTLLPVDPSAALSG